MQDEIKTLKEIMGDWVAWTKGRDQFCTCKEVYVEQVEDGVCLICMKPVRHYHPVNPPPRIICPKCRGSGYLPDQSGPNTAEACGCNAGYLD